MRPRFERAATCLDNSLIRNLDYRLMLEASSIIYLYGAFPCENAVEIYYSEYPTEPSTKRGHESITEINSLLVDWYWNLGVIRCCVWAVENKTNPFEFHEEVLSLQPMIPPKRFDLFPPD